MAFLCAGVYIDSACVKDCMIQSNSTVQLKWPAAVILIPTLLIAMKPKSLSITVISGVLLMAGLQLWA
ncbi:hypothetical protein MOF34_06535 [Bacillus sp. T17B1]|nr:hypothetical protein [Bacillus sp. T17B1]